MPAKATTNPSKAAVFTVRLDLPGPRDLPGLSVLPDRKDFQVSLDPLGSLDLLARRY